jgi:hypothetical protein
VGIEYEGTSFARGTIMNEKRPSKASAVQQSVKRAGVQVRIPCAGEVILPPPQRLAFFGGLAALAAIGLIEWPVAVIVVAGHALADQHWSRIASGIGEALEEA